MRSFKGQAALEFMMTYGWAILVVLAAIGALSYFGILNPSRFTPDTCLASSGFSCPGKPLVTNETITFSLVNGLGYALTLPNVAGTTSYSTTLASCDPATGGGGVIYFCPQGDVTCTDTSILIEDGAGATIRLESCDFSAVNVIKGELQIPFRNPQSMLTETLLISITGKSKT
ncbi:MAG: hypothetical protein ACP5NW_01795 [Candidatus Woesearchaeota archaeon]